MDATPADEELAAVRQAAEQLGQDAAALQTALGSQQIRTEQWQQYAVMQVQTYAEQAEGSVAAALPKSLESAPGCVPGGSERWRERAHRKR